VRVSHGDNTQVVQCDEEGFFYSELEPSAAEIGDDYWQSVQVEVVNTPIDDLDTTNTTTQLPIIVPSANAAFGVISDLDDTIVQTDVLNLFKMLRNTIFRNAHTRLPFDGVVTFYQSLQKGTDDTKNPIFYVSSSPWNLYDLITDFYKLQKIPLGPIFLRDIGLSAHAIGGKDHMGHKLGYISKLLDRHPDLPFILLGDSGQKDPWVYEEAVRRYPGRIPTIYIRDVTNSDERREEIAVVQAAVAEMGSEMLLIETTCEAANHAFEHGYISAVARDQVCAECGQPAPVTA
jgi:phosphatidate phosphatase APP1